MKRSSRVSLSRRKKRFARFFFDAEGNERSELQRGVFESPPNPFTKKHLQTRSSAFLEGDQALRILMPSTKQRSLTKSRFAFVLNQTEDVIVLESIATLQECQLDDEATSNNGRLTLLCQFHTGFNGTTRCKKVIN